jgi:hypothetical protein
MHGKILLWKAMLFLVVLFVGTALNAEVLYQLDFQTASGNVEKWFEKKGWEFKENIEDMNPRFENGSLVIEPDDDDLGAIVVQFKEKDFIRAKRVRIEWGVNQYSAGADWEGPKTESRNTREPISLMIFFGKEKLDSGSAFVPNLPYFISLFLGEKEKAGKVYYGNYWQKGGRYLCDPCDGSLNKTFITDVNIAENFQKFFGRPAPPVTGLTIEIDAQDTEKRNGRHSKAFIKKIEFFDQ